MLNGNPAVDIFNGLKLAAGGELGIGVGEEEWGCGEREVLEGFIGRTDGLVDLIVSRFGDASDPDPAQAQSITSTNTTSIGGTDANKWQGTGRDPSPSDGVIFSGVGAISRQSIKAISSWVELLYKYERNAYGVRENPSAIDRPKRNRLLNSKERQSRLGKSLASFQRESFNSSSSGQGSPDTPKCEADTSAGIPPPIVTLPRNSTVKPRDSQPSLKTDGVEKENAQDLSSGTETLMKYLTLGIYGSKWGAPAQTSSTNPSRAVTTSQSAANGAQSLQDCSESQGHFLIGLQGNLDQDLSTQYSHRSTEQGTGHNNVESQSWNHRTMLRTLQVERVTQETEKAKNSSNVTGNGMYICSVTARYPWVTEV